MVKDLFNCAACNRKVVASIADKRKPYIIEGGRRIPVVQEANRFVFKLKTMKITFELDYCRLIALLYLSLKHREAEPVPASFNLITPTKCSELESDLCLYELTNNFIFGGVLPISETSCISVYFPVRYCLHSLANSN